jgi:hypothetical protein
MGWDGMGWGRLTVHQGFQAVKGSGADYWRVTPPNYRGNPPDRRGRQGQMTVLVLYS